jgi:hypothetical protein
MRQGNETKSAVVKRVYYSLFFSVLLDAIFALLIIAKSRVN